MAVTIAEMHIEISGDDIKRLWREEKAFKAPRRWMCERLDYMAHADNWMMVRSEQYAPFVMSECDWRKLAFWEKD